MPKSSESSATPGSPDPSNLKRIVSPCAPPRWIATAHGHEARSVLGNVLERRRKGKKSPGRTPSFWRKSYKDSTSSGRVPNGGTPMWMLGGTPETAATLASQRAPRKRSFIAPTGSPHTPTKVHLTAAGPPPRGDATATRCVERQFHFFENLKFWYFQFLIIRTRSVEQIINCKLSFLLFEPCFWECSSCCAHRHNIWHTILWHLRGITASSRVRTDFFCGVAICGLPSEREMKVDTADCTICGTTILQCGTPKTAASKKASAKNLQQKKTCKELLLSHETSHSPLSYSVGSGCGWGWSGRTRTWCRWGWSGQVRTYITYLLWVGLVGSGTYGIFIYSSCEI